MLTASTSLSAPASHNSAISSKFCWRRRLALVAMGLSLAVGNFVTMVVPALANETVDHLSDGVNVFGESPEPGQFGVTYLVMEVNGSAVKGGFYQPASSFDCFHGNAAAAELSLTVVDSYAQTEYPFALALESNAVASQETIAAEWVPTGFHVIDEVSQTDHDVLQACGF
ncbi:MAG: hypothetical protein ACFB0E_02375 [Leptolyngbyaceae cyanobacterium]